MPRLNKKTFLSLIANYNLNNKEKQFVNCLYAVQDSSGGIKCCVDQFMFMAGFSSRGSFFKTKDSLRHKKVIKIEAKKDKKTGNQAPNYYEFTWPPSTT